MKIILILLLILFILTSAAYANKDYSSVADALNDLSTYEDVSVVYGDNAAEQDNLGALMISSIFKDGAEHVKKASEITKDQHLILVGGPCANPIAEQITDEKGYNCDDWKFKSGESVTKVFKINEKTVILVAGTTLSDTWRISNSIRRYTESSKLKSSTEVVFETADKEECKDCEENSFQLTSDLTVKGFDISGDNIVFYASGSYGSAPDIYTYNLKTKKKVKIGQGDYPRIDNNNNIVFIGRDSNWPTIELYNIATKQIKILANADLKTYYLSPNIHNNHIIWEKYTEKYEDRDKPYELYLYNLDSDNTELITDIDRNKYLEFEIYNENIVYEDEGNIYLLNLNNKQKKQITSHDERQAMPVIYEDMIAWVDARKMADGKKEIYLYDISTGKEQALALKNFAFSPGFTSISFSNNKILWTDYRNNDGNVYSYDVNTKAEQQITFNPKNQGSARIGQNHIIWIDHRNNGQDLYAVELP